VLTLCSEKFAKEWRIQRRAIQPIRWLASAEAKGSPSMSQPRLNNTMAFSRMVHVALSVYELMTA